MSNNVIKAKLLCMGTVIAIVVVLLVDLIVYGAYRQRRTRAEDYRGHTDNIDVQKYDRGYDRGTPT
jgi:hypothetical protein